MSNDLYADLPSPPAEDPTKEPMFDVVEINGAKYPRWLGGGTFIGWNNGECWQENYGNIGFNFED